MIAHRYSGNAMLHHFHTFSTEVCHVVVQYVTEVHVPAVKPSQLLYICWQPLQLALNAALTNLSPRP